MIARRVISRILKNGDSTLISRGALNQEDAPEMGVRSQVFRIAASMFTLASAILTASIAVSLAQEIPIPAHQNPAAPQNPVAPQSKVTIQNGPVQNPAPVQNPGAVPGAIPTPAQIAEAQSAAEQKELLEGLTDAGQSAVDIVRFLEAFVKKHPDAAQRKDLDNVLARAAIESKDDRRTVLYGERALANTPDDLLLLDRVARSLLALAGSEPAASEPAASEPATSEPAGSEKYRRENAAASLAYSTAFAAKITQAAPPDGKDAARKQDDRDRALARALLYQSRAKTILGENAVAEPLAAKAFAAYPSEEAARQWSETLDRLGRAEDAVARLADAFAIPDAHATDADRAADRKQLGEQYRKLHGSGHGSEQGLGDAILAAYDRTAALLEERRARLRAIDPNATETEPMRFTLTGLDGQKLTLASLKGSVVILDFWATWCQPCRVQHPMYEAVKQRFKDRSDVVFLAIDTDEDRSLVAPFLDQIKWTRASVYFDDGLQRLLQVTSIPTTILFDKQGRVASRMTGFLPDKFVDQLSGNIQSALQQ